MLSPLEALRRRGGFSDRIASEASPSVRVPGEDGDSPPGGTCTASQPDSIEISPLRLHRLDEGRGALPLLPAQSVFGDHITSGINVTATPPNVEAEGAAAVALGSAPLSGFLSGRFTPRGGKPPLSARGMAISDLGAPAESAGTSATDPSGAAEPTSSTCAADDDVVATSCGDLRAFCMRASPIPGGGTPLEGPERLALSLPRSFWDTCLLVSGPGDEAAVCWPSTSTPPEHLRFFAFPASVLERLHASRPTDGAPDGLGFTFSFTASDGSVRWGCAVTGAESSRHASGGAAAQRGDVGGSAGGALTAVSFVLLCDWPLVRPMLDVCRGLFQLHQSSPGGVSSTTIAAHLRPFATALAMCQPEVAYLMMHTCS